MFRIYTKNTMKKNLVIVDAGANIGNHTIFFAKFLDAKRVYAFEPQKYVFEILSKNIKLNNLENKVKLYNIGLGEKRSKGSLIVVDENNLGGSKLNLNSEGEIEVMPLDDILFNKEDKVDLIKIDVEGMELDVLKGAKKILSEYHPDLYIEASTESQFLSISQYLSNYNYIPQKRFNYTPTFLFKSSI